MRYQRRACPVSCLGVFFTFAATLVIVAALPSLASGANDRFLYNMTQCCAIGGPAGLYNGELTTADTGTAANQRSTGNTLPWASTFALSPDGQLIAEATAKPGEEPVLSLSRVDGSERHAVMKGVWLLSFAPNGTQLLVGRPNETKGGPCAGVCLLDLDGTGLKLLTSETNFATISPDGTKLTWVALGKAKKTTSWNQIYVSKADGSSVQQLTNFTNKTTPPGVYSNADFGPNGLIAFWGEPLATTEIWTIKSDGTGLAKVPIGIGNNWFSWTPEGQLNVTRECGMYTVNPDGSNLSRVPVNEPSSCKKFEGFETGAIPEGVYRQPSTKVDYSDYLARQFEPVLRFDSSEQWRPLNVNLFLEEGDHEICESGSCDETPITSVEDLNRHTGEGAYVNIAGQYSGTGTETEFHSPYTECISSGLRDCDTGPHSAIYWREGGTFANPPEVGYPFIDYWFFYRANYFYDEEDFHEGDWEGVTIAPSLTAGTFDYAAFSQHGQYWAYLRDVLRCEDVPTSSTPESGTCGSEGSHEGFRVDVFPANGSHANYTTPCSETIIMTSCRQNAEALEAHLPERGYDGEVRWGRAFDSPITAADSLLEMPNVEEGKWTDWAGLWGKPTPENALQGDGPRSPARQDISVECAKLDNDEEACDPGPRSGELGPSFASGLVSPGLTALACSSWAGKGISAAVCNPGALRHAVLTGAVGDDSGLSIAVVGENTKGKSAAGRGIAQLAGEGLRQGSVLRIRGRVTNRTVVLVRTKAGPQQPAIVGRFLLSQARTFDGARRSRLRLHLKVTHPRSRHPKLWLGHAQAMRVFKARRVSE